MAHLNTDSGNFYPNKTILDYQFDHTNQTMENVHSDGIDYPMGAGAYHDLPRHKKLVVNGDSIYEDAEFKKLQLEESDDSTAKLTNCVFNKMENKLSSTHLALQASHLMRQSLGLSVLDQVARKKGVATGDAEHTETTHLLSAKDKATVFNTDDDKFTYIHEELIQKTDREDLDQSTFFKIKTVVKGPLEALERGKAQEMSLETVYSKERPHLKEAANDSYSFFNRESYLKV